MAVILVEGWRFLPHSYAIVNQFQCLELLSTKHTLYHRDLPYYNPTWKPVRGLFTRPQEALLEKIPPPPADQKIDGLLRIGFPYDLRTTNIPSVVFGTSEGRRITPISILGAVPFAQAYQDSEATIITPSNWSRLGFLDAGADPARVRVVPHGIDPHLWKPINAYKKNKLRRTLGWEGFVFLHIGAMTGNKGLDLILKAFARIAEQYPEARLVLKGLDALYPSEQFLMQTFHALTGAECERVVSRLIYYGETRSFEECAQLYQAADAYISPYRAEGFNMPVLEAAACGLPVICTQGGPTDDFTTKDFAFYVESTLTEGVLTGIGKAWFLEPDLDHLICRMEEVLHRTPSPEIGSNFVRQNFTWSQVIPQLLQVVAPKTF